VAEAPLTRPADRYALADEIARGGMGVVYRATDTVLSREVAVKVLQEKFAPASAAARRFVDEAHITGQLQHPGVPAVHDLGTLPDGRPFLAMKLIEGKTLDALLADREPPALIGAFEAICQAVAFAHSRGVIHRDLKPANVMVGAFGEVQVMDWGLAKDLASGRREPAGASEPDDARTDSGADPDSTTDHRPADVSTDDRTRAGHALGTPAYMPPEQARGDLDRIDRRSDVFALGGVLCAILTGQPPYTGHGAEVMAKAERGDLADAVERLDACGADAELVALAKRCLSAEPESRPADAGEVAAQVAGYRAEVERRLRTAERQRAAAEAKAVEQRKKRRWQLAVAAAALVIVAGGAAFVWWQERQAGERARKEGEHVAAVRHAGDRVPELIAIAANLRREYKFEQAKQTLAQAAQLAATAGLDDLKPAVAQAQADFAFVVELDAIRMRRSIWIEVPGGRGRYDRAAAPPAYRMAFAERGLDVVAAPDEVGARVEGSAVCTELLVALDDWAVLEPDPATRDKVLAVSRRAEPHSGLNALRDPAVWEDRQRIQELTASVDVDRFSAGLLVAWADVMTKRGLDPANLLRRGVLLNPREYLIVFALGQLLAERKNADAEAIYAFRVARALRPDQVAALHNLAVLLGDSGDLPGAIEACRVLIQQDRNRGRSFTLLGALLLDAKEDFPGAIEAYQEAIRLGPGNASAHYGLGVALGTNGDSQRAMKAYEAAIRLDSNHAMARNNLGNILSNRKEYPKAIAQFREAIRIDPGKALFHNNLGIALKNSDDLRGAEAEYQEAIRLDSNFAKAYSNLGVLLAETGRLNEAIPYFEKAVELDPNNADSQRNLALARKQKAARDTMLPVAPPPRPARDR
jgi:tetratricopeptide (TPR) repeat protein